MIEPLNVIFITAQIRSAWAIHPIWANIFISGRQFFVPKIYKFLAIFGRNLFLFLKPESKTNYLGEAKNKLVIHCSLLFWWQGAEGG